MLALSASAMLPWVKFVTIHQLNINFETVRVAHISVALTTTSREENSSVNGCYFPAPFETV